MILSPRIPLTTALISLALGCSFVQAGEVYAGKIPQGEFMKFNKAEGEQVKAVKVTEQALSEEDQTLLTEIATGGMMQLETSKLAVGKSSNPEIKVIAQAEVDEQSGLDAKLKEIAAAKKAKLPSAIDEKAKKMVADLEGKSGTDFDEAYLALTAIRGHEALLATMTKVKSDAKDPNLQEIAKITLPMIELHLSVAKDEAAKAGK